MNDCGVGRVISEGRTGWTRVSRLTGQNPQINKVRETISRRMARESRSFFILYALPAFGHLQLAGDQISEFGANTRINFGRKESRAIVRKDIAHP